MKNKLIILGIGLIAATMVYLAFPQCKEVDQYTIVMTQLKCATSLDLDVFREKVCKELRNEKECTLTEDDRGVVERMFFDEVNECVDKDLKSNNLCTDQVEKL